jgi:hypothetical protein
MLKSSSKLNVRFVSLFVQGIQWKWKNKVAEIVALVISASLLMVAYF